MNASVGAIKLTSSQFTFGFELEGYVRNVSDDNYYDVVTGLFKKHLPENDVNIHDDGSVDCGMNSEPFEASSSVLAFTPQNLTKVRQLFDDLPNHKIRTNSTCGLHFHIGKVDKFTDEEAIWITCHLAFDKKARKMITEFENCKFYSGEYAERQYLKRIRKYIIDRDFSAIGNEMTDEKFRVLRMHPQGTLEWRGPRKFLNTPDPKKNAAFIKRFYDFVSWIRVVLAKNELAGIDREVFIKNVKAEMRNKIFSSYTDYYAYHERDKRFSRHQNMEKLTKIFEKFPWLARAKFEGMWLDLDPDGKLLVLQGTWNEGVWEDGQWHNGTWNGGTWKAGLWHGGQWNDGIWLGGTVRSIRTREGRMLNKTPDTWTKTDMAPLRYDYRYGWR